MFHRIVVPVDGSTPSQTAVALALRLATEEGASVIFAHTIEVAKIVAMTAQSPIGPAYALDAARDAAKEILDEALAQAKGSKTKVSAELVEGDCVTALLDLATQRGADLIVVGSHGRGGLSRALLGSVAEGILRRADVPVLVTHAPHGGKTISSH
jgi:nucleotide-binding universal stress UspA family protein